MLWPLCCIGRYLADIDHRVHIDPFIGDMSFGNTLHEWINPHSVVDVSQIATNAAERELFLSSLLVEVFHAHLWLVFPCDGGS
eukprot:scaffold585561_cov23-Prasinocladus_malaysianus.AAC.1